MLKHVHTTGLHEAVHRLDVAIVCHGRQGHLVAFEKSDLFFVCILRPLSSQIVKQESEIAAAQVELGLLSLSSCGDNFCLSSL